MADLVILGAGGHASDVLSVAEAINELAPSTHRVVGLLASGAADLQRFAGRDVRLLGPISMLAELSAPYVIGVGYPEGRRSVHDEIVHVGLPALTLVHPKATVCARVAIGEGTVIMNGAHVGPSAILGEHVYVGHNSVVSHDVSAGNYCSVFPGAVLSGNVHLGSEAMIGANATVLENRSIGDGATVAAGATVISDVPSGVTVMGTPARER
jgi:sugar O-acyltransferase (sialic acid O-acetyltransferase NeuD family)